MEFKSIGIDTIVDSAAQIKRPCLIELGNHVAIDSIYCSTSMRIGDYVHLAPFVCIIGGADSLLIMDHFSGIAANSTIVCAGDDFTQGMMNPQVPMEYKNVINKPVVFKKFTTTGVGCVVMPGVTLAEGSVLGANSVLTKSTEPWTIYVGSPARPVKDRDSKKILDAAQCLGY